MINKKFSQFSGDFLHLRLAKEKIYVKISGFIV